MSRSLGLLLALCCLVTALTACGGDSASDVDPAPFRKAMEEEFARRKYGVTIDEIQSIDVQGDAATATVKVAHKESTGMRPTWTVTFEKEGDGWKMTGKK